MFRCRLHSPDGDDLGESTYAVLLTPGEEILLGRRCSGCCMSGPLAERGCAGKAKRGVALRLWKVWKNPRRAFVGLSAEAR
jgi:hypothetical protein